MPIKINRRADTPVVPMAIYDYYVVTVAAVLPLAFMTFSAQARNYFSSTLKNSTFTLLSLLLFFCINRSL